jgi:hypothetical protein
MPLGRERGEHNRTVDTLANVAAGLDLRLSELARRSMALRRLRSTSAS